MSDDTAKFAYDGLDRVLHEKARLGILTSLLTHPEGLLFGDIKAFCALTDGNLSRHLQVLYREGLIEMYKGFENRRPQTLCRLSEDGRQRFTEYLNELSRILEAAEVHETRVAKLSLGDGWMPA